MCAIPSKLVNEALQTIDAHFHYFQVLMKIAAIPLTRDAVNLLSDYARNIITESGRINLISKGDVTRIAARHIYESLLLTKAADLTGGKRLLDIGSGAGFPGIPLKIWNPDIELCLFESNNKKYRFLLNTIGGLNLENAAAVCKRAEEGARGSPLSGSCDIVTARSVSPLGRLLKWAAPYLKEGGVCLFPKGGGVSGELRHVDRSRWTISLIDMSHAVQQDKNSGRSLIIVSAAPTHTAQNNGEITA